MTEAELIERIQRLERANGRLWFTAMGALALLAVAVGFRAAYAAPAVPQKITAHEFDVVDRSGNVRIRLDTQKNGFAMVQVLDTAGVVQAQMIDGSESGPSVALGFHKITSLPPGIQPGSMTPDIAIGDQSRLGPMISLSLPGSMLGPGVSIGVTSKRPGIMLTDSKGHGRAAISLFATGEPGLEFSNEVGRNTVALTSLSNGSMLEFLGSQDQKVGNSSFPVDRMELSTWGLSFDDKDGTSAITLGGVGPEGTAERSLSLDDAQGNERATMRLGSSGVPLVAVRDAQGKAGVGMELNSLGAPDVSLTDAQGFEMDLGSTGTVVPETGQTQQTSAASITMFGNDKNHRVIWRAPQ